MATHIATPLTQAVYTEWQIMTTPDNTPTEKARRVAVATFRKATYLSACEVERALAFRLHYEKVCQYPNEIGLLGPDDLLIVDFDAIQFGDTKIAVRVIREAANRGVPIGLHTYQDTLVIQELMELPGVVVAKNQLRVRAKLRRLIAARK